MGPERFTFFWQERPFSQWSPSKFIVDGVEYTHAEQYMMAEKARFFGDNETLVEIMKAQTPAEQKALGRAVKNFDSNKWAPEALRVVYRGNYEKFKQNPKMRDKLFATEGTTLVEASPEDRIWGIGLGVKDPRCYEREHWQGKNQLGDILTRVRDDLLKEKEAGLRSKNRGRKED